jgi:hypothetical protein
MKIYIGQIEGSEIDEFGDDGLVGPDSNGNYYGQYVEIGTNAGGMDEVAIGDGCDRMVPIAVETLPDLIAALQDIQNDIETLNVAKRIKKLMKGNTVKYVEDEEVTIDWTFQQSFHGSGW